MEYCDKSKSFVSLTSKIYSKRQNIKNENIIKKNININPEICLDIKNFNFPFRTIFKRFVMFFSSYETIIEHIITINIGKNRVHPSKKVDGAFFNEIVGKTFSICEL